MLKYQHIKRIPDARNPADSDVYGVFRMHATINPKPKAPESLPGTFAQR